MECQEILAGARDKAKAKNSLILYFNFILDKKSKYFSLNESALEDLIEQLDNLVFYRDLSYWLTLARINELALLCTENYANNGELGLVGDFLLNPRLILIHVRGQKRPIVKKRHMALTEQFGSVAETVQGVIQWLKTETVLEMKLEALLPDLEHKMEKSGYFSQAYFESLNKRIIKITELTGFLSSGGINDNVDLYQWAKKAGQADRELLESKLCRCNLDRFFELGRQAKDIAQGPSMSPGFPTFNFTKKEESIFTNKGRMI